MWKDLFRFAGDVVSSINVDWDEELRFLRASVTADPLGSFGGAPTAIDRERATRLAFLCHTVYVARREGPDAARALTASPDSPLSNKQAEMVFAPGAFPALAVQDGTDLVIACRGSVDLKDWANNLSRQMVGAEGIHGGFDRLAGELWPWVVDVATGRPARRVDRVIFTGHSLGAAAALLLAHRFTKISSIPAANVLFGLPRTASRALAPAHEIATFQLTGDMIPEVALDDSDTHGTGYLLTERYEIVPAPPAEVRNILHWARLHVEVNHRAEQLVNANQFDHLDMRVVYLLVRSLQNYCEQADVMNPFSSFPLALASTYRFITDRPPADTPGEQMPEVFRSAVFTARARRHLRDVAANPAQARVLSKAHLNGQRDIEALALTVMWRRHAIENYMRALSLGTLDLKTSDRRHSQSADKADK